MPARWWGAHKGSFNDWYECRRMMRTCFVKPKVRMTDKYDRKEDPCGHVAKWAKAYGAKPPLVLSHHGCQPNELVVRNRALPWHR